MASEKIAAMIEEIKALTVLVAPQQRNGGNHYDTEYERKEDSLRLRLSQPPQYGDTAEMADGSDG